MVDFRTSSSVDVRPAHASLSSSFRTTRSLRRLVVPRPERRSTVAACESALHLADRRAIILLGPLDMDGTARQALTLALALRREYRMEVEVWGTDGHGGPAADYCAEHGIPWKIVDPIVAAPIGSYRDAVDTYRRLALVASELRAARPDVIIPFSTRAAVGASLVWRFTGASGCVWQHRRSRGIELGWVERLAALLSSRFISNSEAGSEFLRAKLLVAPQRISTIRNGIVRAPAALDRVQWRRCLGVTPATPVVTIVAHLDRSRDHQTAIRAWARVVERSAPLGLAPLLVLAGRFDETHASLQTLTAELGIEERVRFLGSIDDITGLLDATDICLLSSSAEGLPNAVLEGMAAGLPIVASDIAGVREAVGEEGAGGLFPAGDADVAAQQLMRLVRDRTLRQQTGALLRLRAMREFGVDRMIEETAGVLGELVRRHAATSTPAAWRSRVRSLAAEASALLARRTSRARAIGASNDN